MRNPLVLALLGLLFAGSVQAATLTPCNFGKFAGQVMPIPSSHYLKFRAVLGNANVSVTQAVPTLPGHIIWKCSTGGANWQECLQSTNTNACGSAAPVVSAAATDWEANPVCRTLDQISGTTVNDIPNQVGYSSDTSNTFVAGSYCSQ